MRTLAQYALASLLVAPWCATGLLAQAAPAGVGPRFFQGFQLPTVRGTLSYSLTAAERLTLGSKGTTPTYSVADFSGNIAYLSDAENKPFSLVYTGGYLAATGGGQPSAFFNDLNVSQVLQTKHWKLTGSDVFRYLPETATTGLSGIAGIGGLGLPPITTGGSPLQQVLTRFATRIENNASGTVERFLTGSTSVDAGGSYSLQRFPNTSGAIESDQYSGSGGVVHRIDALNSIGGRYTYSKFAFVGVNGTFVNQGVNLEYNRQWTRKFSSKLSVGPQRTSASKFTNQGPSLSYTADAQALYKGSRSSLGANYSRATNAGSGFTYGARTDTLGLTIDRALGPSTYASASLDYARTDSLLVLVNLPLKTRALIGDVQLNRALNRRVSAFCSYTAEHQTIAGNAGALAGINGLIQVIGFGVTYSPPFLQLGRH